MSRPCTQRQNGFALILVIWAVIMLASLASGFSLAVRHETRVAGDTAAIAHAEAAATAALHTAVLAFGSADAETRWQSNLEPHQLAWPGASIVVRAQSESGRIDINRAPRELLVGLFEQVLPNNDANELADAVVDWRDRDDEALAGGSEKRAYSGAGFAYTPPNMPFHSVNELSQVMGFNSAMVSRVRQYLTVYSRQPRINATSADLVTLNAVPGIDRDDAEAFIAERDRTLAEGGTLDFTALRNGRRYLDTRPGHMLLSLDIDVRLSDGLRRREHAVIQLNRARGYNLLLRETLPIPLDSEANRG